MGREANDQVIYCRGTYLAVEVVPNLDLMKEIQGPVKCLVPAGLGLDRDLDLDLVADSLVPTNHPGSSVGGSQVR